MVEQESQADISYLFVLTKRHPNDTSDVERSPTRWQQRPHHGQANASTPTLRLLNLALLQTNKEKDVLLEIQITGIR